MARSRIIKQFEAAFDMLAVPYFSKGACVGPASGRSTGLLIIPL